MASVNKVILVGFIGKDPEIRYLPSGDAVANFSVATTDVWKDKEGQKQERTEWSRCNAFGKTAEAIGQYVKKGSQVYIEGKLATRKWQDKESGQDRYATEIRVDRIQFLDSKPSGARPAADGNEYAERSGSSSRGSPRTGGAESMDDDIPF